MKKYSWFQSRTLLAPLALFLVGSLTQPHAQAGTEGGNSQPFEPRDRTGQLIETELKSTHPQQETLLNLIKNAEGLPLALKSEMLGDLDPRNILIFYSNAEIKIEDLLIRETQAHKKKVKEKTTTGPGDQVTKETQVEFESLGTPEEFGLIVSVIPNTTLVASYTTAKPKVVYYFTHALEKKTPEQQMIQVLHEQAHRLTTLGDYARNEDFVDAYSKKLLDYLQAPTPDKKNNLLNILSNARVFEEKKYPTQKQMPRSYGPSIFEAPISIPISGSEIENFFMDAEGLQLQVKQSALKDYPGFEKQQYWLIQLLSQQVIASWPESKQIISAMEEKLRKTKSHNSLITLDLMVTFKLSRTTDSTGRVSLNYEIQQTRLYSEPNTERLELFLEESIRHEIRKTWPSIIPISLNPISRELAAMDPEFNEQFRQTALNSVEFIRELKTNDPTGFLVAYRRWVETTAVEFDYCETPSISLISYIIGNHARLCMNVSSPITKEQFAEYFKASPIERKRAEWVIQLNELKERIKNQYAVQIELSHNIYAAEEAEIEQYKSYLSFIGFLNETYSRTQCVNSKLSSSQLDNANSPIQLTFDFLDKDRIRWVLKPQEKSGNSPSEISISLPKKILSYPGSTTVLDHALMEKIYNPNYLSTEHSINNPYVFYFTIDFTTGKLGERINDSIKYITFDRFHEAFEQCQPQPVFVPAPHPTQKSTPNPNRRP